MDVASIIISLFAIGLSMHTIYRSRKIADAANEHIRQLQRRQITDEEVERLREEVQSLEDARDELPRPG